MTSDVNSVPRCILCESSLRYLGDDFTGKQIYQCRNCELALTPISLDSDAAGLYDDPQYFNGWGCNLEFDYERFEPAIHQQMVDYLDYIAEHTSGRTLLDVGTGSGLFPCLARERGYEVEGTDLSKHVSENVSAKAGFAVYQGELETISFTRQYDIITMLHVLEHTSNPVSTLNRCRELLSNGGYVIVVVPNYQSLDSRIKGVLSKLKLKSRPYKHLALGHHNYVFSLKSLKLLGKRAGLEVLHCQTRQPAWRAASGRRLLERYSLATWCWIVYRKTAPA